MKSRIVYLNSVPSANKYIKESGSPPDHVDFNKGYNGKRTNGQRVGLTRTDPSISKRSRTVVNDEPIYVEVLAKQYLEEWQSRKAMGRESGRSRIEDAPSHQVRAIITYGLALIKDAVKAWNLAENPEWSNLYFPKITALNFYESVLDGLEILDMTEQLFFPSEHEYRSKQVKGLLTKCKNILSRYDEEILNRGGIPYSQMLAGVLESYRSEDKTKKMGQPEVAKPDLESDNAQPKKPPKKAPTGQGRTYSVSKHKSLHIVR